ncbi:hypothetical protein FEM49_03392 (plasmid) [Lactiplantibacillus plantarum]|nr:hypothetical protein FEM49_03392 [Lactiplantibacillus plantarum]
MLFFGCGRLEVCFAAVTILFLSIVGVDFPVPVYLKALEISWLLIVFTCSARLAVAISAKALFFVVFTASEILLFNSPTNNAIPKQVPICLAALTIPEAIPAFSSGIYWTAEIRDKLPKPNPNPSTHIAKIIWKRDIL